MCWGGMGGVVVRGAVVLSPAQLCCDCSELSMTDLNLHIPGLKYSIYKPNFLKLQLGYSHLPLSAPLQMNYLMEDLSTDVYISSEVSLDQERGFLKQTS